VSRYAKALFPFAAGVVVGVLLLVFGFDVEGRSVLLAAAGAAGLTWRVPNAPSARRRSRTR
jgi:hypothetical protein